MRRIFLAVTALAAMLSADAVDFVVGGVKYATTSETTCSVSGLDDTSLKEVTIPETVTNAGTTYTVTEVGSSAFLSKAITGITLPETVTSIGASAFKECKSLTRVNIPSRVTTIPNYVFSSCTALTEITIPAAVTSIGGWAFSGDSRLAKVNIPTDSKLQSLGDYAFSSASYTTINLPATLKTISAAAMGNSTTLATINLDPANPYFTLYDGCIYTKDKTKLVTVPGAKTSITFPSEITACGPGCGKGSSLKALHIPDGVITIQSDAFGWCNSLTEVTLGNTLETLERAAFYHSPQIKKIVLPATLKSIGFTAVSNAGLTELICKAPTPPKADDIFYYNTNDYKTCVLKVPAASLGDYKGAAVWKDFTHIEAIDEIPINGDNSAKIISMVTPKLIPWSQMVSLVFKVQNEGRNPITSLGGILTIDGDAYPEQSISNLNIPSATVQEVTLTIPLNIAEYEMELNLTKVNGVANENPTPVFKFELQTYDATLPEGCPEATYGNFTDLSYLGMRNCQSLSGAIKFVDPNLVGCKVIGAKVIGVDAKEISNVNMWASSTLSTTPDNCSVPAIVSGTTASAKFLTPVELTASGYYFGISLDIAKGSSDYWPMPVCGPIGIPGGFYLSSDNGAFDNLNSYGTLQLVLILDKEGFTGNRLQAVQAKGITAGLPGKGMEIPVEVVNYTGEEVANIHYAYNGDGQDHQGTITTKLLPYATAKQEIKLPVAAIAQPGNYTLNVTLDQVNGAANVMPAKTLTIPFSVGEFATKHLPIMEEMTGTGCGYCPRGMLGMAEMKKAYPEFIAAAYHRYNSSDPMYCTANGPFSSTGAPNSILDRMLYDVDPFFGTNGESMGIAADYLSQRDILAPANLGLKTSWNADKTVATAEAEVEFSYVGAGEAYKLGYLFTIDGAHAGTEDQTAWKQSNYYSGSNSNPLINSLCNGTFDLSVFNHVVIDNSGWQGTYTCSNAAPKSKFTNTRTFTVANATLSDRSWLTDGEHCDLANVNAIVLLIDNKGRVRNACMAKIGETVATGVANVIADGEGTTVYYDLMGRRVQNPQTGIYVKVQDGKASKVAL